jgi:hypothetical protein
MPGEEKISLSPQEMYSAEGKVDSRVLTDIVDWIKTNA